MKAKTDEKTDNICVRFRKLRSFWRAEKGSRRERVNRNNIWVGARGIRGNNKWRAGELD